MAHEEVHQAVTAASLKARKEPELVTGQIGDHKPGGGDHHVPYTFAFPQFWPHVLAWMKLRERVLAGELVS